MNWKPEVQVGADPKWCSNALVFATEKEAQYSADELASRWLLVTGTRAVSTNDPVNYRIDFENHTMIAVEPPEITGAPI